MTPGEIGERVRRLVKEAAPPGVEQFGFCPLPALSGFLECRGKRLLPKEGGSAILLLLPYQAGEFPGRNVARYALCNDYHRIAGDILQGIIAPLKAAFPGEEFHPFADSSPIPEVEAGALAGLGFAGKNGQLVTPWYGSLAFLCEIRRPFRNRLGQGEMPFPHHPEEGGPHPLGAGGDPKRGDGLGVRSLHRRLSPQPGNAPVRHPCHERGSGACFDRGEPLRPGRPEKLRLAGGEGAAAEPIDHQ